MYLDITDGQAVMQGQAHSHGNRKQEFVDVMSNVPTTFFFRSVAQSPNQCCRSALTESSYHFWRQLL